MVGHRRDADVDAVLRRITQWAERRPDVRALALVGSWARGTAQATSDVDVVLLSESPERYLASDDWLGEVGGLRLLRTVDWGGVTERRFALPGGLEVELDVGTPAWASVERLDPGTASVVSGGMHVLHDPDGLLERLLRTVRAASS